MPILFILICLPLFAGESNKDLARRFYEEVWFKKNPAFATQVLADPYTAHDPRSGAAVLEKPGMMRELVAQWESAAEVSGRIDDQVAEGDKVVTRWTWTLKLNGWWQRTVAGHESIEVANTDVFRFENGKVVEVWRQRDDLSMQEQLGVLRVYYLEGFAIGVLAALVVSRVLFRRRSAPPPDTVA